MIVEDADGTLILTRGSPKGRTALTLKLAKQLRKPFLVVDLARHADSKEVHSWIKKNLIRTLNVAGPREGETQGIHREATRFLHDLMRA